MISEFEEIARSMGSFSPNYTVDSLKALEKWYFELWEKDNFASITVSQGTFERMMALYFNEVVVRNKEGAKWTVTEYPFLRGRYELGIECRLMSMMGSGHFINLCTKEGNKRRNFMYREYKRYYDILPAESGNCGLD